MTTLIQKKNIFYLFLFFTVICFVWAFLNFDLKTKNKLTVEIKSDQNYSFQVFWIPFFKKNFSEKYSEYFKINKSENFNSYKILLPGYPVKNILRIDPIDGVGEVVIKDLIISGNNQTFQFVPLQDQ